MTMPPLSTTVATTATVSRTVARPVANLGNTCYMNCVLQALAHAPELCLAIDCEPHRRKCPYAKKKLQNKATRSPTPTASSDEDDPPFFLPRDEDVMEDEEQEPSKVATRKSRRRSPHSHSSSDIDNGINARDDFCALCEFEEHIRRVYNKHRRDKPVVPSTFVNGFIEHVAPWFKLGVQEDSHEFLRLLIDAMQNSCLRARSFAVESDFVDEQYDEKNKTSTDSSSSPQEDNDKEYPFSLFRGTVESNVVCDSCKASSSTLDPIEDIGLDLGLDTLLPGAAEHGSYRPATATTSSSRANSPIPPALADVQSALQRFARAESLDEGYKCEKCGKFGKAKKQSRLASVPPILTLQLKRFRYGERAPSAATNHRPRRSEVNQLNDSYYYSTGKSGSAKIEGPVKFDTIFDLRPYLTQKLQEQHASMFCRLFAVIVHAGKNSHSGHYVAYVRNVSKNEWWKMDDGRVSPVSEREVKQAEAYMLFYRVVQHPLTLRLEELHRQQQLLQQQLVAEDEVGKTIAVKENVSAKAAPDSRLIQNNRKRRPAELCDGLEWARVKTNTPPHLLGVFRKAQELIADDVQLSPDFFLNLSSQAARNAKSSPPFISEDNIIGGADRFRRSLCDLLYGLAKHIESSDALTTAMWLTASSNNNNGDEDVTKTPPQSALTASTNVNLAGVAANIAVVEPEDADLL